MSIQRGDVGRAEATRDPIFLLETREIRFANLPFGHDFDCDVERVVTEDRTGEDGYTVKEYAEAYPDSVIEFWRTVSVWFTREEATAWAKSHEYRFEYGWRVYCVCAEGDLAELLKAHSMAPTGTVPVAGLGFA